MYTYIPSFFGFLSHLGHQSALSRVPCATQQVLISYLFYTQYQQCIYVNPVSQFNPRIVFYKKQCWNYNTFISKKRKKNDIDQSLTLYTNTNSQQITDINLKHKAINLSEKTRRKSSKFKQRILRLDTKRTIHKRKD